MDKVKVFLAALKKHHFWPLAAVIIAIGWYAWRSGANHFDQLYSQGSSELNQVFNDVNSVASNQPHPNQYFITEVKNLKEKQLEDVKSAWLLLYDNQKKHLTWEKEFAEIGNLKPDEEISAKLRDIYWNYSKYQVPKLFEIIDIRGEKTAQAATEGAGAGGDTPAAGQAAAGRPLGESSSSGDKPALTGTVVWPESERTRILNAYKWSRVPRTKQIRYAQEDYWVYGALLNIIKDANGPEKNPRNVAIKKIESLDIAQDVGPPSTQVFPVPDGTVMSAEEQPSSSGGAIGGAARDGPTDEQLDNGRYVSADGAPLTAPDTAAQYKLMPIRMRLIMDQRRLPDLLVACANSPLPVEVRQVQFNVGAGQDRAPTGRNAMGSGGGGGSGMANRGGAAAAAPTGPARQENFDTLIEQTQYDQRIEVRGFIYIFNPPDLAQLGEATVEESAAATTTETIPAEGDASEAEKAAAAEQPAAEQPAAEQPAAGQPAEPAGTEEKPAPAEGKVEQPAAGEATPPAGEAPPAEKAPAAEPVEKPAEGEGTAPPN